MALCRADIGVKVIETESFLLRLANLRREISFSWPVAPPFESRAVICPLALGVNSMFVRCVGQLTITVVLSWMSGFFPTRSTVVQPCVQCSSFSGASPTRRFNLIWPAGVCKGVALLCLACLPSCYGSCKCTYFPRRLGLVS